MKSGKTIYLYLVAAFSALGGILFGYDTGVISGAILFIRQDFGLSPFEIGLVVSAVLLGAVLGSSFAGILSDRLGRKRLLIITAFLFIISSLASALAPGSISLALARVLVGIAIGVASMSTPLYIAEISPAPIRGRLVSLNQLAITIGIVTSYLVDYSLAEGGHWRWMLGLSAVPAVIFGTGMFFLPESPRWLVKQGRDNEARHILLKMTDEKEANQEILDIKNTVLIQVKSLAEMMTPWLKRALVIGLGLAILQQFTGINTVIYYSPVIFEFAGYPSASAAILGSIGIGTINVAATIVALWLLDRVGRRPLLLVGIVGMVFSLIILGFSFFAEYHSSMMTWISLISLMLYTASFAISLGPIFWLMISEIYPLEVRGQAMSIATIANWLSNLLIALSFLSLIEYLGPSLTFWLYAIIGIGAWFFCYFLVPETKQKTLEEIERNWQK